MSQNISVSETGGGIDEIKRALEEMKKEFVCLGVPEEKSSREQTGKKTLKNAELAFMHTNGIRGAQMRNEMNDSDKPYSQAFAAYIAANGSPLWKVPPRPIIEPAVENDKNLELIAEQMKELLKAYIDNSGREQQELQKLGMLGQNIIRDWFDNPANNWPPNAPATIEAKKRKGSTEPRPLIDTAQLRKSMTYVIRKAGDT